MLEMLELLSRRGRARRQYRDLIDQFDRLLALAGDPEDVTKRVGKVSAWSVGEQLEHIAKVDAAVSEGIETLLEDSSVGEGGPSRPGRGVLFFGLIPRGKGRSPEALMSTGVDGAEVRAMLEDRRKAWAAFESRLDEVPASRSRRPHPALGNFNAGQWLRFAQIHLRHHLRIIDEILAA